jgi:MarR family transcriptional regulator for hemolysin
MIAKASVPAIAWIEQPTMAATLSRMERDGLIERRPDPTDGRSSLVSLTAAAREKAKLVMVAVNETNAAALETLSEQERTALLDSLAKIVASLGRRLANS